MTDPPNTPARNTERVGPSELPDAPTVSIVTVVYNNRETVRDAIESVRSQSYSDIEYIVIDGASTDGTLEILQTYEDDLDHFVSEPDEGLYDAMNKGIEAATGEIVGILNSDDFYASDDTIEAVVHSFHEHGTDCVYGDIVFVHPDRTNDVVRYWQGGEYDRRRFRRGWMPPHPATFFRRRLYEEYGGFKPKLDVSADYELMLRFLYRYEATATYLPRTIVRMRVGGKGNASIRARLRAHAQDYLAWLENGRLPNPITLTMKPLSKLPQYAAGYLQSVTDVVGWNWD